MPPTPRSSPAARRPPRRLAGSARPSDLGRVLVVAAGVATGAWLVAGPDLLQAPLVRPVLFAALSAALVTAGAAVLHGAPPGRLAQGLWVVATGGSLLLSSLVSGVHVAVALGASALLYLFVVRRPLPPAWRPIGAGMSAALAVIYGGWSVGPSSAAFVGAAFVFLVVTTHQLIRRIEGPRARTEVPAASESGDALAAGLVLGLTVGLSGLPYLMLGYGGLYLLTACAADLLMLRTAYLLVLQAPRSYATRARALLQGALVVGLAALAFASV